MKVAIVSALFNSEKFLPVFFNCLERLDYSPEDVRVIAIDNANSSATRDWLNKNVVPRAGKTLPHFELIRTEVNTGYAEGNNLCIARALEQGAEAVYLLNDDAFGEPGFLRAAVERLKSNPQIGAVQSLILLHPQGGVNSMGNALHFLGFGYCQGFGLNVHDAIGLLRFQALGGGHQIGYASGAAVLIRAEALKKVGAFDPGYFLYHEDVDLSWRLREAGYTVEIEPSSLVHHHYEFKRSISKFYWMERNRYRFCLEHYKLGTLLILAPAFIMSEAGLLLWSVGNGTLGTRLKAYGYFLNPAHWAVVWQKRREVQARRIKTDRQLFDYAVADIHFEMVDGQLLRFVNPLMRAYFSIVRRLIVW